MRIKLGLVLSTIWAIFWGALVFYGFGWPWWHSLLAFVSFFITWYVFDRWQS